ncbi:helicase C-terminal domain-containing protein [Tenuibacillus multivorans]|uniref:3'-5' exonuclease DinG n=1 Tax=Tenuibacillus multivorans TaxID=237069 RepID=A0A1H0CSJ1_9BACI|nr:helicase C-terminal domain-containing protein [Tenuibacillus multivorans]GEL76179.1 ATP-dependent helicase DinG [Tenuibacillus multivorans]SDN60858.1 ATP-dependent DNA helicase DinG [Tenuibacillus multivorans]
MNRFVVVDLETTGHSPKKGDEIIEIGLVVIEGNEIVDQFSTKIKPNKPIPNFITNLTGISPEDVAESPSFDQVIPKLLPYFEDGYFVAHQVQFDFEFLNESLQKHRYTSLKIPIIDTVELARVLFPTANSYKLSDIADYLNIDHQSPHRALSDAYVTSLLLIEIMNKLEGLPYPTLTQISPLTIGFKSDIELIIEKIINDKRYKKEKSKDTIIQNGFAVKQLFHLDESTDENQLKNVDFNRFLNQFNDQSMIDLREDQFEIARQIEQRFNEKKHLVIEASTGLGKTLAYLLPAMYHSIVNDHKTVVSTSTIQLQHQLMSRDWPLIQSANTFGKQLAILKSPSHYIHLLRLRHFIEHYEGYNYDLALSLSMILVWLTETSTGDRDEIQLPSKGEDIWPYISGDYKQLDDQRHSYFQLALKQTEQASIIIVNHAFLIHEKLYGEKRIPDHQHIIIDEAHRFEGVMRKQLGKQVDYVSLIHILNSVEEIKNTPTLESAKNTANQFFRSIYQAVLFLHSEKDALTDTGKIQLPLDYYHLQAIKSGNIHTQLNDLLLALEQLLKEIKKHKMKNQWDDLLRQNILTQLTVSIESIKSFFNEDINQARWIDIDQDGAKNAVQFHLEPIEVSEIIREKILNCGIPVVFTSATLQTNHSFTSFLEEMGLPEDTSCVFIPSPYDFLHQVKLYVPSDFPDIKATDPADYAESVGEYIFALAEEINHKPIVLFTSFEMLKAVHQSLRQLDTHQELTLLSQGIHSGSREKLKKMFEKAEEAILLGTSSFWEGVDIQDQSDKLIILVRLPFDTPNHPLFQAKSKQLEEKNQNAFYHWMLPQAVLRFRQAFGRLIRSNQDRGQFFILDQRIMSKNYGRQFLKSIPKVPVLYDRKHCLLEDAKNWLSYK